MIGFREFLEGFVSTVKKQLGVPKNVWMGMPVIVSNAKIGGKEIKQPTNFYVSDFDDQEVTIRSIASPGLDATDDDDKDPDDEINMDGEVTGGTEFTIPRKQFYKLLEPEAPPAQPLGGGMF